MSPFITLQQLVATETIKGGFLSSVQTENLTVAYTNMEPGTAVPLHQHHEEAIDIILEGILEMQVGEKTATLTPGMIVTVPSHVPHMAKAVTNCRVVTIFHPKRNI